MKLRVIHISFPGSDYVEEALLLDSDNVYDDDHQIKTPQLVAVDHQSCLINVGDSVFRHLLLVQALHRHQQIHQAAVFDKNQYYSQHYGDFLVSG